MGVDQENGGNELHLTQTVTLYTEVTPVRAAELLRGKLESAGEARGNLIRWLSEIVLIQIEPEDLKALGISRMGQPVFATPILFQGGEPMRDKVLLAFDTDPACVFVAEGDHLTAMRQFGVIDIGTYVELQQSIGQGRSTTFEEFQQRYSGLPDGLKSALTASLAPLAADYWKSVVSYSAYSLLPNRYVEPETLLTPNAEFNHIRRL